MRSRRRTSHSAAAATSIQTGGHSELLEQRQLLSVTNSARQIVASEDVIGTGHTLQIEEVYIVDNELWVLSRLTSIRLAGNDSINDLPEDVIHLQDEVNLVVPDLEVRHFRIGGFGYENPTVARIFPTEVGSVTTFHQRLENQTSEQLYSRIDPALSEWRDNVFNALQQQADKQYADSFGMEAPERPIWILPVAELPELWQSEAMFQNFALTGSVSEATAALSDTNVQVDGIDEADIVETDGDYIYTISDRNELVVLKAARDGEAASVVSRTDLAVRPTAIFLYEGRLTVISTTLFSKSGIRAATINNLQHRTTVTILDVSTPESPSLIQESVVDGRFQDARAIGSQVYVVIGNNSNIPYLPSLNHVTDTDFSTGRRFETRSEYLHRLNLLVHGTGEGDGELAPPSVYQRTVESDGTENLKRLGWLNGNDELITPVSGQLTSVIRFDSNSFNPGPVDNIGVYHRRHSDSTIYASMNAIYLVATEYDQIENNGLFIVPHSNQPSSRIHKIDISSDKMVVGAIGSVPGIVESQFSLDEHNGYLRIATTTGNVWNNTSFNNMFVLQDVGDDLVEVGSVRDLAQGERIYSVRFDGDRAWMVTFRQVDPVYSFDLSDPGNPNVTGELKITGYSEYLQLIDENLLLAIGRDASETGQLEGVQVSLFDISDMTTPTLIDRYSFDGELWSYSSALLDHHAFHYLPDFNLLAIPYFESGPTSLPSGQSLSISGY